MFHKKRKTENSQFLSFSVSQFLRFSDSQILRFSDFQILRFSDFQVLTILFTTTSPSKIILTIYVPLLKDDKSIVVSFWFMLSK